jgi:hypothetical protein
MIIPPQLPASRVIQTAITLPPTHFDGWQGADPFLQYTVLILQGGSAVDKSPSARTVTTSGATQNSTDVLYNGQKTIKLVGNNGNTCINWDPSGAQLDGKDWCYELFFSSDGGGYLYVDDTGNNGAGLMMGTRGFSGTHIGWLGSLNRVGQGFGGTVVTYPWSLAYFCAERIGRFLYLSKDGVVNSIVDLGSTSFSFNNAAINPRVGEDPSVSTQFGNAYATPLRLTIGVSRYGGQNFTPPPFFPVS